MKVTKFKIPIYDTSCRVGFYKKSSELKELFKGFDFGVDVDSINGGLITHKGKSYLVFCTEEKGFPTPGIIAHEAKHLVNKIFIGIQHPLCRYQDEPECYLLGWIVDKIHKLKEENENI